MNHFLGGRVTSRIGMRNGRFHRGNDVSLPRGTPIPAPPGQWIVERSGWENPYNPLQGFGRRISLRNTKTGDLVTAGHLGDIGVSEGDVINGGQVIALSGNTGRSSGPHLHLQSEDAFGNTTDPFSLYGEDAFSSGLASMGNVSGTSAIAQGLSSQVGSLAEEMNGLAKVLSFNRKVIAKTLKKLSDKRMDNDPVRNIFS